MRKLIRPIAIVLGVILLGIGGFALYVEIDGIPKYTPEPIALHVNATPEKVARGKHLAAMLCVECHLDATTGGLTGKDMGAPPAFGVIYSKNITNDPKVGIGAWTDGEIAYLLRTGIAKDGQYIPPYMAKLPHMADDDIEAVIAFLRSDDPWVKARDTANVDSKPAFLTKFLSHVAWKPLAYPTKKIEMPPQGDEIALGKYLTWNLDCWTCHSSDFKKLNVMEPEKTPGYLGGGNDLGMDHGRHVTTPNVTFDDTGIGKWSRADFVKALRTRLRPDGSIIQEPMMSYFELSDEEAGSMYEYMKTAPKISNEIERNAAPPNAGSAAVAGASPETEGARIYHKYACNGCHGETGVGTCDLRPGSQKYPADEDLKAFIQHPQSKVSDSRMPQWDGVIHDDEYAPLIAHVRSLGAAE